MKIRQIFDITKIIFDNPNDWKDVTNGEKRKNIFLLNRRFSIKYPLQANMLQLNGINSIAVADFWQRFLSKQYKKTPGWMFLTGSKKVTALKEAKSTISKDLIRDYSKVNKIDIKSINDALIFFNEDMTKELKSFEKMQKSNEK
jgi:hypothetical protein